MIVIDGEKITLTGAARKARELQAAKGKSAKLKTCYNELARGYGYKDWQDFKAAIKGKAPAEGAAGEQPEESPEEE